MKMSSLKQYYKQYHNKTSWIVNRTGIDTQVICSTRTHERSVRKVAVGAGVMMGGASVEYDNDAKMNFESFTLISSNAEVPIQCSTTSKAYVWNPFRNDQGAYVRFNIKPCNRYYLIWLKDGENSDEDTGQWVIQTESKHGLRNDVSFETCSLVEGFDKAESVKWDIKRHKLSSVMSDREIMKRLMMKDLVLLVGPTGSGKSTFLNRLSPIHLRIRDNGAAIESKTKTVVILEFQDHCICDMPGFSDTESRNVPILSSILEIRKIWKKVKLFLFTIPLVTTRMTMDMSFEFKALEAFFYEGSFGIKDKVKLPARLLITMSDVFPDNDARRENCQTFVTLLKEKLAIGRAPLFTGYDVPKSMTMDEINVALEEEAEVCFRTELTDVGILKQLYASVGTNKGNHNLTTIIVEHKIVDVMAKHGIQHAGYDLQDNIKLISEIIEQKDKEIESKGSELTSIREEHKIEKRRNFIFIVAMTVLITLIILFYDRKLSEPYGETCGQRPMREQVVWYLRWAFK